MERADSLRTVHLQDVVAGVHCSLQEQDLLWTSGSFLSVHFPKLQCKHTNTDHVRLRCLSAAVIVRIFWLFPVDSLFPLQPLSLQTSEKHSLQECHRHAGFESESERERVCLQMSGFRLSCTPAWNRTWYLCVSCKTQSAAGLWRFQGILSRRVHLVHSCLQTNICALTNISDYLPPHDLCTPVYLRWGVTLWELT